MRFLKVLDFNLSIFCPPPLLPPLSRAPCPENEREALGRGALTGRAKGS